jgi:hypothetical protein
MAGIRGGKPGFKNSILAGQILERSLAQILKEGLTSAWNSHHAIPEPVVN